MGRLIPVKGFRSIVISVCRSGKQTPALAPGNLGEGELRYELEQQIKSLGLTGRVQSEWLCQQSLRHFRKSEFLCHGLSLRRVPLCLAGSDVLRFAGGSDGLRCRPREIIRDGVDGILVPNGDVKALAAAMDHLMSNAGELQRFGSARAGRAGAVWSRSGNRTMGSALSEARQNLAGCR